MVAADRVGRNNALVRRANEEIRLLGEGRHQRSRLIGLICECSRRGCLSAIAVPADEYEALRRDDSHYLVAPGHIWDETTEQIVVRTDRYWILRQSDVSAPTRELPSRPAAAPSRQLPRRRRV
jgi:hypothetical protein